MANLRPLSFYKSTPKSVYSSSPTSQIMARKLLEDSDVEENLSTISSNSSVTHLSLSDFNTSSPESTPSRFSTPTHSELESVNSRVKKVENMMEHQENQISQIQSSVNNLSEEIRIIKDLAFELGHKQDDDNKLGKRIPRSLSVSDDINDC